MSCCEKWTLFFELLTAVGTIGAVILALFGDYFKNLIFRAKISIEIVDPKGELTNWSTVPLPSIPINRVPMNSPKAVTFGTSGHAKPSGTSGISVISGTSAMPVSTGTESDVIYYHLRIVNQKTNVEVKQCKVSLKEIHTKRPSSNDFYKLPLNVPPKFFWAPAESSPQAMDIATDQVLDFGYITKESNLFMPAIWPRFNSFKGDLKPNETFKYILEITANNLSPRKVTVEVSWNGNWSTNLESMAKDFQIRIL